MKEDEIVLIKEIPEIIQYRNGHKNLYKIRDTSSQNTTCNLLCLAFHANLID